MCCCYFFFSSRRRHTRCALVTGVQTCALPIYEYYQSRWPGALAIIRGAGLPANVHVLERDALEINDVTFVGATLWTDFERESPMAILAARSAMTDFRVIRRDPDPDDADQRALFLPEHALADHRRSCAWLAKTLGDLCARGKKAVLVTHHGIAPGSTHPRYRGDRLNGAFVSDLTALLDETRPVLAIHGHVHDSFDYTVGATRIVVNPRGYARDAYTQENGAFDSRLTVEI